MDDLQSDAVQNQSVARNWNKEVTLCIADLPLELQFMIWKEAVGSCELRQSRRRLCQLNGETDTISYKQDKTTERQIVPVYRNGMNIIFWFRFSGAHGSFQMFLSEIKDKVIFMFTSPNDIPAFFVLLRPFYKTLNDIPKIRISIPLFSVREIENPGYLSMWIPRKVVHGYSEKAFEHVASWMDVVQNVPPQIEVEVTMHRPWMDYRSLRGLSGQIRRGGRTVDVRINEPAWDRCPKRDLHIGLTVGAIKGIAMAKQSNFTADEANTLVEHGCRGFRAR